MEENFFINIKENSNVILKENKKEEKKQKYLEKKLLQQKRKRDKPEKKVIENENKPKSEYDELVNFYEKKENKQIPKLTHKEKQENRKKIEIMNTEIAEEMKEMNENIENIRKDTIFSVKNFSDLKINEYLKKVLNKNNYTNMTKIQKKSIPVLLQHKNVIVKSETGSGKTLAYLIPLYEMMYNLNIEEKIDRKNGIYCIIFAPTHELCLQIEETFNKIKSACINLVYGTLIGGQKIDREKAKLRKGLNVLIVTPGRLLYHLKNTQNIRFDKLKLLIFDEADILLNMGFDKDIKECLSIITNKICESKEDLTYESFKKFKIFLISATIDNRIRELVIFLMKGYKTVGFEKEAEDDYESPSGLSQYYSIIYDEFRLVHLLAFLLNNIDKKIIIFVSTCDLVNFLSLMLPNLELNTNMLEKYSENSNKDGTSFNLLSTKFYKLHGKMNHSERKEIFKEFNKPDKSVLICTDVAARGLDFPHVDWIIHYDVNPDAKEYCNRMGRTARLDNTGNSLIFLMKHEEKILSSSLCKFKINQIRPGGIILKFVEEVNIMISKNSYGSQIEIRPEAYKDEVDENEKYRKKYFFGIYPLQKVIKNYLFKDRENVSLARRAFKSTVRSYPTFNKHDQEVFNIKQLNLTRFARSFGLYKETTKFKLGDENYVIDYQTEKNNTRAHKKFNNKRLQKSLVLSEFL